MHAPACGDPVPLPCRRCGWPDAGIGRLPRHATREPSAPHRRACPAPCRRCTLADLRSPVVVAVATSVAVRAEGGGACGWCRRDQRGRGDGAGETDGGFDNRQAWLASLLVAAVQGMGRASARRRRGSRPDRRYLRRACRVVPSPGRSMRRGCSGRRRPSWFCRPPPCRAVAACSPCWQAAKGGAVGVAEGSDDVAIRMSVHRPRAQAAVAMRRPPCAAQGEDEVGIAVDQQFQQYRGWYRAVPPGTGGAKRPPFRHGQAQGAASSAGSRSLASGGSGNAWSRLNGMSCVIPSRLSDLAATGGPTGC